MRIPEVLDSQGVMTTHLVEGEQWSVQCSMLPFEEVTPQCFHVGEICSASIKLQEGMKPEQGRGSLYSESTVAKNLLQIILFPLS